MPTPNPISTGGGQFAVDLSRGPFDVLKRAINDGRFIGSGGTITLPLAIAPGTPPTIVHLAHAHLQADCTETSCRNGKIGGRIAVTEFNDKIVPALAAALEAVVDAGCTGPTPDSCNPNARQILLIFDANSDRQISADELRANHLFSAVFAPDLDLLKKNGKPG